LRLDLEQWRLDLKPWMFSIYRLWSAEVVSLRLG
jgi:hypothetical protein